MRADELKPSNEVVGVVIVQNDLRYDQVDRPRVLAANAPSLTSANGFENRVAEGTQNQGERY